MIILANDDSLWEKLTEKEQEELLSIAEESTDETNLIDNAAMKSKHKKWLFKNSCRVMQLKTIFIINFILLAFCTNTLAQNECSTPVDKPDKKVKFKDGDRALFQFMDTAMFPVILNCIQKERINITSLHIKLTVDCKGDILDATFQELNLTQNCRTEMKNKLLTLKGWNPAMKNGKAVCAYYEIPIGNLSFETE